MPWDQAHSSDKIRVVPQVAGCELQPAFPTHALCRDIPFAENAADEVPIDADAEFDQGMCELLPCTNGIRLHLAPKEPLQNQQAEMQASKLQRTSTTS